MASNIQVTGVPFVSENLCYRNRDYWSWCIEDFKMWKEYHCENADRFVSKDKLYLDIQRDILVLGVVISGIKSMSSQMENFGNWGWNLQDVMFL